MIITCGQCQAKFQVAPEQIKVTGSKVRCSNCGYVFMVYRPAVPEPLNIDRPPPDPVVGPGTAGRPAPPDRNFSFLRDDDLESPQARREIRRLLYADSENEEEEDEPWDEAALDEATGRPVLRRRPAPSASETDSGPPPEPAPASTDAWADEPGYSEAPETGAADYDPGLAADPTRAAHPARPPRRLVGDDMPPLLTTPAFGGEVRAPVIRVKGRRNGLFLVLAIFCAALTIGLYYLSSRPEPIAFSEGGGPPPPQVQPVAPAPPSALGGADPRGIEHITFTPKDNLNYFYRKNSKEGELLIITGRVRNSYPEPRSFIRLRGLLLDQHGNTLADRFVYAGNLISEEDLATLPKEEIMARLNIKGGRNGQNMNIAPGQEVPFMVVFDKAPTNKDEYQIIPVGSSPAE
jgi:predicted Zn finger-like uncharacterized protein